MPAGEPNPDWKVRTSPYEYIVRQEQLTREYQIALEQMGIVRENLAECVREEGINHFVNCKELREKYWVLCNDRFRGMVFPEGQEPTNRNIAGLYPPTKKGSK